MLTEKEQFWLNSRENPCNRCVYKNGIWYKCNVCIFNKNASGKEDFFTPSDYTINDTHYSQKDAARFNDEVSFKLQFPMQPCMNGKKCPLNYAQKCERFSPMAGFCNLKYARIAVEEKEPPLVHYVASQM